MYFENQNFDSKLCIQLKLKMSTWTHKLKNSSGKEQLKTFSCKHEKQFITFYWHYHLISGMIFLPVWQHLEMNSKPEEINKDGYHYQTKHSCHEVFTNFKLKEKITTQHSFAQLHSAFQEDLQVCHWWEWRNYSSQVHGHQKTNSPNKRIGKL